MNFQMWNAKQELEMRQEEMESLEKKADIFRLTVQKLPVLEKELASLKEVNDFLRCVGSLFFCDLSWLNVNITVFCQIINSFSQNCQFPSWRKELFLDSTNNMHNGLS